MLTKDIDWDRVSKRLLDFISISDLIPVTQEEAERRRLIHSLGKELKDMGENFLQSVENDCQNS
jgi:hypothetical protein